MVVTKDTLIGELTDYDRENGTFLAGILMSTGMHCIGCAIGIDETVEEACAGHGVDADILVSALNEYLEALNQ